MRLETVLGIALIGVIVIVIEWHFGRMAASRGIQLTTRQRWLLRLGALALALILAFVITGSDGTRN